MARILITCTGLYSNLVSSIALGRALREAGHEVSVAAPENASAEVSHAGFDLHLIEAPQLSIRGTYLPRGGAHDGASKAVRAREAAKVIQGDGMMEALKAASPNLVLADCEHHSAILQSLGQGHRVATLSFMYFTPLGPSAPPLTHATVPGKGVRGSRAAVALSQKAFMTAKRISAFGAAQKGKGAELAAAHRALATELGLDLDQFTRTDQFQAPWSYTLPSLLLVPSELDLPTTAAEHQRFIGPMILQDRARSAEEPASSYFSDAPGKRIFAAFGSMRHPPIGFLKSLIEAVAAHADWHLLIATSHPDLKALDDLPAQVTCTDWVPQLKALSRADCALFHGGAGTLNECVRTETPMIIYPNALDGRGNGARVEFHGVGEVGTMKEPASSIAVRITRAISDRVIKDRLQAIAAQNSESVTKQRAAEAVEALLR